MKTFVGGQHPTATATTVRLFASWQRTACRRKNWDYKQPPPMPQSRPSQTDVGVQQSARPGPDAAAPASSGRCGFKASLGSFLRRLGPGLITGASDDDPSGIATYSPVGAQFGYGMLQEVEEVRNTYGEKALKRAPRQAPGQLGAHIGAHTRWQQIRK